MNLLIIDQDTGIYDYYNQLFLSIFKNINITCIGEGRAALNHADKNEVDLVIMDTFFKDLDVFSLLNDLVKKNIPVVIFSSEKSDRLIVETLRAGALDFLTKRNLKKDLVENIIKRAFLEGDRWSEILKFAGNLHHRPEYERINETLRSYLVRERHDKRNMNLPMGYLSGGEVELKEGGTYNVIYLYMQLHLPAELTGHYDQESIHKMLNDLLLMNIGIAERYGGRTWTRKNDGAFFAFLNESYQQAVLAAIAIYGRVNLFSLRMGLQSEKILGTMGIAAGQTVYRENKSSIYSEALNLSAHLAINKELNGSSIWITSGIYDEISENARRYFKERPDYEDSKVFQFEMNSMLKNP